MDTIAPIDGQVKMSREDLYQRVWQEPMTKLAPQYGLSDVGLAKVCRKYNIPRPPVGYWAKTGVGHHVEQTPLPTLDDESLQEIRFFRQSFIGNASEEKESAYEQLMVQVAERLINPHPLVALSKEVLSTGEITDNRSAKCLNMEVSKASLPRALRILDAVIKKWEELGGRVLIGQDSDGPCGTRFAIDKDAVCVSMTEKSQLVDGGTKGHQYGRCSIRKYTGRLALEISGRWADDLRRRWADGNKQQLENVLGSFLLGLKNWISHEMACRFDDECEARQRQRTKRCVKKNSSSKSEWNSGVKILRIARRTGVKPKRFEVT